MYVRFEEAPHFPGIFKSAFYDVSVYKRLFWSLEPYSKLYTKVKIEQFFEG